MISDPISDTRISDEHLIRRIAGRDQAAFTLLLSRHIDPVHSYLYRMTGSRTDAEDLTQETFLKVWQKASSYQPGRVKVTTWLHSIAHNNFIDGYRRRREPAADLTDGLPDETADPLQETNASEQQQRLEAAIGGLPDNQRSALLLCQVRGFSNAETAGILGISTRALESLIARARRSLRATLLDNGSNEEGAG